MRFSASTCYFASLVATLVLVTTSIPQPTSNTGLPSRPSFFQPSRLCPGLGLSGTTARALDPRAQLEHLPCEVLQSGAVTKVFSSSTSETVELLWHFEGAFVIRKLIRIMEQNPTGKDRVAASAPAYTFQLTGFKTVKGRHYYILLSGQPQEINMTWLFQCPVN